MSVGGNIPVLSGVPAVPMAQARGKEVDRVGEEISQHSLRRSTEKAAEAAGGIGETDGQDHHTEERDADGRRPWEVPVPENKCPPEGEISPGSSPKDPFRSVGRLVDLCG